MQLQAVILPPQSVLDDALAAAQTVYLKPEPPTEKPGVVERFRQRRSGSPIPAPELRVVPSEAVFIRLARFGNVTANDARSLALALGEVTGTWSAPVVHVTELAIELTDARLVINAQLGGDLDGLHDMFRNFNQAAKGQGFFLDRRSFRPEFTVAAIDLPDDPSFLDRLEWEADGHQGPEWQATSISMVRVAFGDNARTFEVIHSLAVGGESG